MTKPRYNPQHHHRRSIRLPGYDYTQPGAYFITIMTYDHEPMFGHIINDDMRLNESGLVVVDCWQQIPVHFTHTIVDAFVVMPNHIHGIVIICDRADNGGRGAARCAPATEQFGKPVPGSLPTIVRSFKSAVTNRINQLRGTPGAPVWQRNYYEHVVRGADELDHIRRYITVNPSRWANGSPR